MSSSINVYSETQWIPLFIRSLLNLAAFDIWHANCFFTVLRATRKFRNHDIWASGLPSSGR